MTVRAKTQRHLVLEYGQVLNVTFATVLSFPAWSSLEMITTVDFVDIPVFCNHTWYPDRIVFSLFCLVGFFF